MFRAAVVAISLCAASFGATSDAGVIFSAVTGNHYEHITSTVRWDVARQNALNATFDFNGVTYQGHLANVGSQAEDEFIYNSVRTPGFNQIWLGGSDQGVEGTWQWMDGPEAGQTFFIAAGRIIPPGMYANFRATEPSNSGNEDGLLMEGAPSWNDGQIGSRFSYIVEYETAAGVVPEPGSFAVFGAGIVVVLGFWRRRRNPFG